MSLPALANQIAEHGRNGDSVLVHMSPKEVTSLQKFALANGTSVTVNPHTGLPEMGLLGDLLGGLEDLVKPVLPAVAGALLGPAGFGVMSSLGAAATVGGLTALSSGSLSKGLMAGMGAYGGSELLGGLTGAGAGAAQNAAMAQLGPGATQAELNLAAANASKNFLGLEGASAPISAWDRLSGSVSNAFSDPKSVVTAMGGVSPLLKSGLMAASPIIADQGVPTTTGMPGAETKKSYYRPYEYDPRTQGLRSLGAIETSKANSMATGGVVALADGGFTLTPEQLKAFSPDPAQVFASLSADDQTFLKNVADKNHWSSPISALYGFRGTQLTEQTDAGLASLAQIKNAGLTDQYNALRTNDPVGAQNILWNMGDSSLAFLRNYGVGTPTNTQSAVYRPLSQVDANAARQGIGQNPQNDRIQGFEKAMADAGLTDEFNQFFLNTGGFGSAYNGAGLSDALRAQENKTLQNSWYDAIRGDLTEDQRQAAARTAMQELDKYAQQYGTGSTWGKTAQLPVTSTKPPDITATEAVRPTATITPAQMQTQAPDVAPQTSTAPPQITATAAPVMPSIPVGSSGNAGYATTRPFDWQSAQIEELPQVQQKRAEDVMTGQSLSAYQQLMGLGMAQMGAQPVVRGSTQASQASQTNPFTSALYRKTPNNGGLLGPSEAQKQDLANIAAIEAIYNNTASQEDNNAFRSFVNTPSATDRGVGSANWNMGVDLGLAGTSAANLFDFDNTSFGYNWRMMGNYEPQKMQSLYDQIKQGGAARENAIAQIAAYKPLYGPVYASGGAVPGYALGGLSGLGGFSDGGQLLKGPGDGVSDSIPATIGNKQPARLADGEFVIPARIVSELGNGSTDAGARKLYAMMDRVQQARGKTTGKKRVAVNSRADKHLPA